MIGHADIVERAREWGLREDIVEKDYVLGWVLWGIGSDPILGQSWVFKGGTCLKKCYIETYRFSEDLDFTVLPEASSEPNELLPNLKTILGRVTEASGIDFSVSEPRFRQRPSGLSTEGRIYYRGPRNAPGPASVKLDLSGDEPVVRPPVLQSIAHPYPDMLPDPGQVRCYSFDEVFAEKIRAMGQRSRPRDLYDIVNLFRRDDLRLHPELIREVLEEKCRAKSVPIPTFDSLSTSPYRPELEAEWENMLARQLPVLPPFEQFWAELPDLFAWLEGTLEIPVLEPLALSADEEPGWTPPPTASTWGVGVPLEVVRFAAANRLCVELGYQGSVRLIEPYSLRRSRAGDLLLHAIRVDDRAHRSYRVDRIQSVKATTRPFRAVWAVEFSGTGLLQAPPTARGMNLPSRRSIRRRPSGPEYIVECPACGKRFTRRRRDSSLRPHKTPGGWPCPARRGYIVDTRYR